MSLKPWREIARPHKDVLEGTFQQSEFAADITQVANGAASPEYQDPENFFSRTFITEGMRLLLMSVAKRLSGKGGDPVIQLQTAFGGGKTHTLLAVYHLAEQKVPASKMAGVAPLLEQANIAELPQAKVAVIDGIRVSPSQGRTYEGTDVNTLWGELAWQLLGKEGYALVADSDRDGTSPGKEVLQNLLKKASPCVILMDELLAYVRQFEPGKKYRGGTFDSNLSFVQALTEAIKGVPNAILLASLPESELEVGSSLGQRALESLEKYFARVESIWKPVATEEAFEIVRRRLFESAGTRAEVEGTSRQFSDFYRQHAQKFPLETQSNDYYERLCHSYPIHPEVFDRLYEDWSTLDKFQRTRGVLQYLAIVIHRLWNADNKDALIMPGSLPLEDADVRSKSLHYLPQGWEPVIEREVDGPRAQTTDLDAHNTFFGSVQAARRTARTIFLGSAPAASNQTVRGVQAERILLGAVQPEQTVGVFEDVLKHLRDKLHYLYSESDKFWFDTRPNLRREMESRKRNINEAEELFPLLKDRVNRVFGRDTRFSAIHIFTASSDVPDEYGHGPKLVVLPPAEGYSKGANNKASDAAEKIVRSRGDQPRLKQNRLIFLAPDYDVVGRLKEQAAIYLAWRSIVSDIESGTLNHDLGHLNQAKRSRDAAEQGLSQFVREAYKWLMAPREEIKGGRPELHWEVLMVSPAAQNLVKAIEQLLVEEEWLIEKWSPIHLRALLQQYYFKDDNVEVGALKVWQDSCHYLYMPRFINDSVLIDAISSGVESEDFFGFAGGKEGERYLGFVFGDGGVGIIDEQSLIIERDTALAYLRAKTPDPIPGGATPGGDTGCGAAIPPSPGGGPVEPGPVSGSKTTQFYGATQLDPVKAKMDFANIMDEVVQQFTAKLGVDVTISVEITANSTEGFDESLQRTVKENCNVLRFGSSEFEEE